MASESDPASRRAPSLVSYCQRILSAHADDIAFLGDDVRYDVIRPVLECCSADTLLRLEQSSPYLEQDTLDLWKHLCSKTYPLLTEQLVRNADEQPASWRDQYFLFRQAEASRLEEVASRLRNQRIEAAERKKEREIKLTDRLPPPKRARTWGAPNPPKTLFQKTMNEATKLRRTRFTPRIAPQIPPRKIQRPSTPRPLAVPATNPINNRITVNAVTSRPSTSMLQTISCRPVQSMDSTDTVPQKGCIPPPHLPSPAHPPSQTVEPRPSKPPIQKKDPTASLFMPKRRALSQLPSSGKSQS